MKDFNDKVDTMYNENVTSIRTVRRQYYPRNFGLSEEFVAAFKSEYGRLLESGQANKTLLERMQKALKFHV